MKSSAVKKHIDERLLSVKHGKQQPHLRPKRRQMSTFKVEVCSIAEVLPHPNAERLEIIRLKDMDWNCVVQKSRYAVGDSIVYIPIDSILSNELELKIFGTDSKVKLHNSRVKTIKLRGAISQGLAVSLPELGLVKAKVGEDVTAQLGITKYEPPVKESPQFKGKSTWAQSNPNFRRYTGIENAKNYTNVFQPDEIVVVTEKIHGTNFRAGYVEFHANTVWKKLKKFLGLAPRWEFVYGSHNVQLQSKKFKGYYDENVYSEAVVKYNLEELLLPGEVVYGEIYGPGIQKGYHYGLKDGERKLVLFDLLKDGEYLDASSFYKWVYRKNLPSVPVLYIGTFNASDVKEMTKGNSVLAPTQKVREGVVVRPNKEEVTFIGRKLLKFISDEYLLKDQTDFH